MPLWEERYVLKGTHVEAPQITIHAVSYRSTHDASLAAVGRKHVFAD